MNSLKKRLLALALSFLMVLGLLPALSPTAAASSQFDSILDMDQQQPSEFDPDGTENPYGYAVDQPFLMNEMTELAVYGIDGNGTKRSFYWYDTWKGESASMPTGFGSTSGSAGWTPDSFNTGGNYNGNMKDLSFVEAVAFDPNGTGRKDHIAYIGFDTKSDSNKIVLRVQDAKDDSKYADFTFPGSASWIKSSNPQNWRAGNYFAITAGDYDGDGKETIVAFATANEVAHYGLYELSCNVSGNSLSVSQKSAGKNLLHRRYVNENHGTTMHNSGKFQDKLSCDLATGDFNGDGIDDLVAVSYLNGGGLRNSNLLDGQYDCEYYIPMMAVSYGGKSSSPVTDGSRQVVFLAKDNGISDGHKSYNTMAAVGLDTGDVDGDGTDEIVVGGTLNTVTSAQNSADAQDRWKLNGEKWNIAIFNAKSDGSFANPGTDDSVTQFHTVDSTGWFSGGTGDETTRSPLSLACVAFNGSIHAEYVFVGGKIFDFSAGGPNELYTVSFIKDDDNSVQSTTCDETFIPSVAVGNFDGNDYGYEQIFFVYSNKQSSEDDYFYRMGVVGGKNYDGKGGAVGSAGGTDTTKFYEKKSGFFIGGSSGQGGAGAEGNWNYNTNFVLVSMDRDDDGVLARYKGKDWSYTDPQVTAVLQMAPYFSGIDLGSDSGETTYAFTQSYEYTTGSGHETSFGVGFKGELETSVATVELQAGSSSTWSQSFEETLTTSTTDSFATKAYDSVVLQRTPVFTYTYEIYDASKGGWSWDDLASTKDGTGFAISVPKTPAYVQMSVTDYDAFVDAYNAQVDEMAEAYKKKTGQAINPSKMEKIGGEKSYLGQEGNPWGYASNLTQISSSTYQLGYNGGETQSSNSNGSAYTKSFESSYGFSFEMSVMVGFKVSNNGAQAGGYASLEYMHSKSSSTTTASEIETSGAVQDLDWLYLRDEYGIPEGVTKSYGFTWSLAKDTFTDLGVAGKNVPVITYNVSNITAPAPAVDNLAAALVGLDTVHLTWSQPEITGRLAVTGYHVYVKGENDATYKKVTENALSADTTEYTVPGLDSNTEYSFVVTTTSENGESVWSNEAVITTPKAYVPLTMDYNSNEVVVKATHLGNVEIKDGDNVEEDTIVYVKVEPQPGYTVTQVALKTEDSTQTVTPVDGQFNFAIQEATTITVTAERVAEKSTVTYTDDYDHGTVSATVNGVPFPATGATFDSGDKLIFTAAPAEGYALKEWCVTAGDDSAATTYAAAGNTFTFHSYAAEHHVSAVFVPLEDVAKTVTLNVTGGGSIIVKDGEETLTPDENGKLKVPQGTTLTFQVDAGEFYKFKEWTDAFADYKNDDTEISLKIDSNVTVGAVFENFLAYSLTYGTQSVDSGSGTLTAKANGIDIKSGVTLTPGTTVDFDAAAGNDSRIQKWSITENGITSFKELDNLGIVTEDAYNLILKANSDVKAAFKTIEKYDLTGSAFSGNGTVTVQRGNGTVTSGTDVLRYYDDLTITLTPSKGYVITQQPDLTGTDTYSYTVNDVTADVDVNYTWEALKQYSVTYSVVDTVGNGSGTHGTLSAAAERKGMELYADSKPSVVYEGGTITFTAAPDAGYRVKEWIVNGEKQAETGNTLTLTPMQDLTVTVQYSSELPKVNFADPNHGTLTAKMGEYDIKSGASVSSPVTFTVVPDENYEVKCWTVNGVEQAGETGNTFTYDAESDCTVAVELQGKAQNVTLKAGTGGTASATDPARYGETITVTATPNPGYVVDTIKVSGVDTALYTNTGKENGEQTATYEITGGTTFNVTFTKKPVVTFSAANGSLTASGTVDGTASTALTSGGYVDFGSAVAFTAAPNSGFALEGWYVDGQKIENTDLTYTTDTLSKNVTVEARFAAIADIQVDYAVNDADMGTITATANGRSFQSGDALSGGQKIVFTATPAEGYRITGWEGLPNNAEVSTDKTTATVPVLTSALNVTANLEAIPQYTVTIDSATHGSISATVDGKPLNSGDTVPDGTQVTFTATPDAYWMFKAWTGAASGSSKTVTLTVNSDVTVGATFTEALLYEVKYSVTGGNGSASGTYEGTPIAINTTAQFAGGSQLQFTATPNNGYMVKGWTINDEEVKDNITNSLTIDALSENTTVTVEFEVYQGFAIPESGTGYTVTVNERTPAETYSGAPVNQIRWGGNVTFTVAPNTDEDYITITTLKINDVDLLNSTGNADEGIAVIKNADGSYTVTITNVRKAIQAEITAHKVIVTEGFEKYDIPQALEEAGIKNSDDIKTKLAIELTGSAENRVFYDIALKYWDTTKNDWVEVDEANFPENGLWIEIDYPKGTNSQDTFTIVHMLTSGENAGHTEIVPHSKQTDGLRFHVTSLSPFGISWIPYVPSGGGGGGGGGGISVPTETVIIEKSQNGTVTASNTSAGKGDTVTLTVKPDAGYILDTLTVTDSKGNQCKLTQQDGKYTFIMPEGKVTVRAAFAEKSGVCDGGEDCPSRSFTDLNTSEWYHGAVDYVLTNALMNGHGNGLFGPNESLSRAQLCQILYNREGWPKVTGSSPFTDVADTAWYADAVIWASSKGIVDGYGGGRFGPEDPITREQLAAILWRYAGSPASDHILTGYTDADQISSWAMDAMLWANENVILNGDGRGHLSPKGNATRAEVAQMLKNFIGSLG